MTTTPAAATVDQTDADFKLGRKMQDAINLAAGVGATRVENIGKLARAFLEDLEDSRYVGPTIREGDLVAYIDAHGNRLTGYAHDVGNGGITLVQRS